jgi:class 3 adenylate cyclase/putative methionine-R-sulfoxide reductase with GAF domain
MRISYIFVSIFFSYLLCFRSVFSQIWWRKKNVSEASTPGGAVLSHPCAYYSVRNHFASNNLFAKRSYRPVQLGKSPSLSYTRAMSIGEHFLKKADYVALIESGKQLTSEIDIDDLLQQILKTAGQLTDSPDGSILLYDEERLGLYFAAAIGESGSMLLKNWGESSNQRVPIQGSKAGVVFSTGEPLVVDSLEADPEHYKGVDQQTHRKTNSMICVPLTFASETMGVIQILNKRTGNYAQRDRMLLENFSGQASVALRNARLFKDVLAHMGLYTSRDATDLVNQLRKPAHQETLTVMFADMRGFTQLCQVLNNPALIQNLLDEFLSMLSEQVTMHGGIVNKFLGDGLLALFRQDDSAKRAVKSAFAIMNRFGSLRDNWEETSSQELSFVDIGMGIVTGEVILGTIGSARVRDFTAIGTPVNLAAAFEAAARGGKRILVDQITYNAVKDLVADAIGPDTFELRKADQTVRIKYKQYQLVRLKPDVPTRLFIAHNKRDREFVEKELTEALAKFGIETWYSRFDVLPGENYVDAIKAGLLKCDWVVVVVSKNSAASDWVAVEVRTAFGDPRLKSKIIPVVLDDTDLTSISDQLRLLNWVDSREVKSVAESLYKRFIAESSDVPPSPSVDGPAS